MVSATEYAFFLLSLRSEEPYFEGIFIAKDVDVSSFVEEIRSKAKSVSNDSEFVALLCKCSIFAI